jgi:predicted HD phosphohydrolase
MTRTRSATSIDDVIATMESFGDAVDDNIQAIEHGLQCAAVLADERPDDLELQVAGLLHDVGHVLVPGDDSGHGEHGASYLRPLLGDRVAELVALHVPAKRWLVTVDRTYGDGLSAVSQRTLVAQGGVMTAAERAVFEAHPCFAHAVTLRRADEAAKVPGKDAGTLDDWLPQLRRVVGTS